MDNGTGCLIITGAPGSGKSTVARLVAQGLARSALIDGDQIDELIVRGRVWALGRPADEAARQVDLCNRNLCALAANFADAAITPVVDWILPDRAQLDVHLDALRPRSVLLVVLSPGADVCRARNARRDGADQFSFDGYDALDLGMREGFGDLGWWLDSSALTAQETADLVLRSAATRARVG